MVKSSAEEGLLKPKEERPSEARHMWLPIFGFFIMFSETGVRQVMNVFVPALIEDYNCTKTQADTAAIVMPSASSLMAGPIAAAVYNLVGARKSICIGSLLCFSGFILGSFAPFVRLIYICGLMIGIGCALMRNSIISVQCEYFVEYRNAAMSFVSIGPGIGVFILPRLLVPLNSMFHWYVTWRIVSVFYIVCFVMGLAIERKPSKKANTFAQLTGIKSCTKVDFILHAAASFCASAVCIIYVSNILALMKENNIEGPAAVYSYQGIASIIGRTLLTIVMWKVNIHIAVIMIVNYAVAQVSLFSASFCYSIWEFRAQNFFSGIGIGMFQATLGPFLVTLVGPAELPGALGYTNLINGIAGFSAVYISGVFVNKFETARAAFYLSIILGTLAVVFAVINSAIVLVRDHRKSKEQEKLVAAET